MEKFTVALCILLLFIGSCTPSPRYTVDRKTNERLTGKTANRTSFKKPAMGTKFRGIASYYAGDFHGKKTANGETFDMNGLTAAHKTLPFNTWLEVRNLSNGRTVIVRINDRGPFIAGRFLDLSYGAAKELKMLETGVQEVEAVVLR